MFSPVLDRAPARRHPTGRRRKRRGRLYRPWLEPCERRILLTEGPLANGPGVPALLESVGANRAITTGPDVQQMPSVAVDPADPQHVVIAYMDRALVPTGYAGIGVAVSRDGGSSWQHTAVPLPSGFDQGAANPTVRFDSQGHVFVSFMAATFKGPQPALTNADFGDRGLPGIQSNNGVFVARSDNGGLIWNPPIAVVSHTYSGQPVDFEVTPDLAIDTFRTLPDGNPNPRYGAMYETWTRIYPAGQFPGDPTSTGGTDVMLAVSKDQGETWQTLLETQPVTGLQVSVIQDPANGGVAPLVGVGAVDQSHLAIGPEGDIYESNFGAGDFSVFHSMDGGASFVGPDHATDQRVAFGLGFLSAPSGFVGQPPNQFRANAVRAIAADPTRPGTVYATEANLVADPTGNIVNVGSDIVFARSIDYGVTWRRTFLVGPSMTHILNDDNDGQSATGLNPDDVITNQALPRLTVDAQGNVAVIWYDTRRDPKNHLLDVFGTVSTDGGLTFSPNFRITDQSFDADAGAFTDATGQTNYYLGDSLGLAVANQTVYAAWTDTRNGNQDVFFTREPISTAPDPPNDRFEPNNTPETATDLGTVVKDHMPKLAIPSGDEDWFRLKAASTGDLTISATPSAPTTAVRLELWDASGMTRLATGTAAPGPGVEQLVLSGQAGQSYLIHVVPGVLIAEASTAATSPRYTLDVQSLTADLGTVVHSVQTGALHLGDGDYYLLTAGASGSLDATLTPGPNVMGRLNLQVRDPGNPLIVLATGNPKPDGSIETTVAIQKGQTVLVRVSGGATSAGDFQLEFTNLDQFATPDLKSIMLPDGLGPSHIALGDLNADGKPDLVVSNTLSDTISVFLGNGDGTFQAPRQFGVGAFALTARGQFIQGLLNAGRDLVIVDVNHDGLPDVIVTNYSSADVSVLLGRGDGTFQPQRRFDATSAPTTLGVGDFNGDGQTDLVAVDSPVSGLVTVSSLLGRGDGTFQPQKMLQFQSGSGSFLSTVRLADFNKDGRLDLVIAGLNGANGVPCIRTFFGNGDGTFTPGVTLNDADMFNTTITAGDVNGDGNPDIVAATFYSGEANVFLGNGDGTFQAPQTFFAGQVPTSVTIADLGSQVDLHNGTFALGPPDGHPDLVITNGGSIFSDLRLPSLVILPGLFDSQGKYQGFGVPLPLSSADTPLDLVIGDLNGDGAKDVAFVDRDGIRITFGKPPVIPPNDTPQTARNLGTVVHVVEPTLTIVPGHEDAYYTLTAPTEAVRSLGPEVLDVSGSFQDVAGPGLALELRDAATGVLLGSSPRFRAVVAQGQVLTLHVFGASGADGARGAGAYMLDLDVLPQLISVEAQPPLPGQGGQPGGPTSSLVLTFQGDRLDPATAQDPAHYRVTWLGPDGRPNTADDQVIPISSIAGSQSVVYDPSANVDVASGKQYPTAVHQTVTLLFAGPLPTGSYRVELSPAIQTAPFNEEEQDLLADESQFAGHPVVFVTQGQVEAGSRWEASGLVAPAGNLGDFRAWEVGTPFLTQLHDDLGALLDAGLTNQGDSDGTAITAALNRQIQGRFISGLSVPGRRPVAVLVIWLDPVSFALADPGGSRITYNLQSDAFDARIPSAYVNVTGNIEVVAIPVDLGRGTPPGSTYVSDVSDVPARARGGAVYFGPGQDRLEFWALTDGLRTGQRTFDFVLSYAGDDPPGAGPVDHPASPSLPGPGGHPTNPEPHQAPTQPGGLGFNPPALSLSSVTIVTVLSSGGQEGSATASVNSTGQAPVPTRLASGPKDTPRIRPSVASQGAAAENGISDSVPGRPASPDLQLEKLRRAVANALGQIVRLFARRSHVLRFLGSLWPISRVVWRDLAKWVLPLHLGADERSAPARPGVLETPNPEPIEGGDGLLWRDGGCPEMQPRVSPPGGIPVLFAIALLVAGVGPGRVCDRPPCGRCRPGPRE